MRRILVLIALSTLCLILLQVPLRTQAAPPALPPRPGDLPPRPTAVPSPTPTVVQATDDDEGAPRAGATIELHAPTAPASAWTVVQWQDLHGDWHDVDGWQGALDESVKRWWVSPADFRTGPFRWVVYDSLNGEQIAASESFSLPFSPYEVAVVEVP